METVLRQYLIQRGFDDTIIKEWGLEPKTDHVLISYFDTNGNLLYKRANWPEGDNGHNGAKYVSPSSDRLPQNHTWLYNLQNIKYITDTMLLVEGEYNCISAWIMGFYGLGVSGQTVSLKDYHLKLIPTSVKKIIILLDEPEFAVKRAREILKYYEHEMKVYIAKYPDKKDANDYLKEGNTIEFKRIINIADPYIEDKLKSSDIKVNIPENDFVEAYKNYAMQITDAPVKYQELMALSIIATVLSRQVYLKWGVSNLYPNLFIVLIGKSAVMRKTECLNIAKHILRKLDPELILPNEFTQEGLFNLLSVKPVGLVSWNEFGSFLINANTKSYQAGIKEFITDVYDCPDLLTKRLSGKEYKIENLCLNIATASTIQWLIDRITEADTKGGFLGRFIYVLCNPEDKNGRYIMPQPEPIDLRNKIVDDIKKISILNGEVKISDEAKLIMIKWLNRHEDELEILDDTKGLIGFYSRLSVYLLKVAMLYEVSGSRLLEISENSMLRAIKFVNQRKKDINELMQDHVAFTKEAKDIQKVFNIIKEKNDPIPRGLLTHNSNMTARQLNEVLETLIQSDRVKVTYAGEGRKKLYFIP